MMFKWFLATLLVGVFAAIARSSPTALKNSGSFSDVFDSRFSAFRDAPEKSPKVAIGRIKARRSPNDDPRSRRTLPTKREVLQHGSSSLFKVDAALRSGGTHDDKVPYQETSPLIGAIAGLPPPTVKSKSISDREGKSSPAFSQSFHVNSHNPKSPVDSRTIQHNFPSNPSSGVNSRTVLHNFPNNQNPKFKILEVRPAFQSRFPDDFKFNKDGLPTIGQVPNSRTPVPKGRGQISDPVIRGSLFVNTDEANIPISQTTHGGQEGPIIVHSGGRPTLVHLNNRFQNSRSNFPNSVVPQNTFRGRSFKFNNPQIQFAFPPNLFPIPQQHPDTFGVPSTAPKTVLEPGPFQNTHSIHNAIPFTQKRLATRNHNNRHRSQARTPAPRTSRQSSRPFHHVVTPPAARIPPRILPANAFHRPHINTAVRPQLFHAVTPVHINRPVTLRPFPIAKPRSASEYSYGYAVDDRVTGDQKKVFEMQGPDGVVRGQYSFLQPDGLYRVVSYTADEDNGFRAHVEYIPTNVKIRN